jgi:mannose-6-phosphate isomerase-like protein (cupin superfamily)
MDRREVEKGEQLMTFIKNRELSFIDFHGLTIYDYTADKREKSSFALIHVPPSAVHGLSWSQRSDKYYYVLRGELEFEIDKKVITLGEKDFCIVHKGEHFDYRNLTEVEAEIILVHTPDFDMDSEVFD